MNKLKLLICILIMLAVGLTIVLIVLNVNNNNNEVNDVMISGNILDNSTENEIKNDGDAEAPKITFNTTVQQITSNSMLYSISSNINKYFQYIKVGNIQAVNEMGGNSIYNISNNAKYVVKQAYSTSNEFMTKYYTYGILSVANGDYTSTEQEIYMIIYLTSENKGYKIQTITNFNK